MARACPTLVKHHHVHVESFVGKLGHSFLTRAVEAESPIDMLNQTEVRVQMTQSYPQFISEPLAARQTYAGNLAATKRCSQHADDLKRRVARADPHSICKRCGVCRLDGRIPESKCSNDCSVGSNTTSSPGI